MPAWWAACEAINQCKDLLSASIEKITVTAHGAKGVYHANITMRLTNRSNAQLTITPIPLDDSHDYILLGSGGLLYYDSLENMSGIKTRKGFQTIDRDSGIDIARWINHSLDGVNGSDHHESQANNLKQQRKILSALRTAHRKKSPVQLKWSNT